MVKCFMPLLSYKDRYSCPERQVASDIGTWKHFLSADTKLASLLEEKNRTGLPFGSDDFYTVIESLTGIDTRPGAPGRSPKKE